MDNGKEAQLLAEFMIKRKAKKQGKQLTEQFWNSLVWKKEFQQQKIAAYGLLKLYTYEAILSALNHKDINWIYSLRNKQIIPYIKDEKARLEEVAKKAVKAEKIDIVESGGVDMMKGDSKRNKLSKLN